MKTRPGRKGRYTGKLRDHQTPAAPKRTAHIFRFRMTTPGAADLSSGHAVVARFPEIGWSSRRGVDSGDEPRVVDSQAVPPRAGPARHSRPGQGQPGTPVPDRASQAVPPRTGPARHSRPGQGQPGRPTPEHRPNSAQPNGHLVTETTKKPGRTT